MPIPAAPWTFGPSAKKFLKAWRGRPNTPLARRSDKESLRSIQTNHQGEMIMGLRIQNNVEAFNAHRQLTATSSKAAKAMEKLSSGYRVNRAADDAAGLAISEKMRAQISGLAQSQR